MGLESDLTLEQLRRSVGIATKTCSALGTKSFYLRPPMIGDNPQDVAQTVAEGIILSLYRYTEYKSNPQFLSKLLSIGIIAKDTNELKAFGTGLKLGEIFSRATCFARDLINRPPSDTTPEDIVKEAKKIAKGAIQLKTFNKTQIQKMGMGALLGVNRGSHRPPYFIHFIYRSSSKPKIKIGICGKGITFDSGGLSLKPAASMETMKYDMAGAATVLAIFKALSELKPSNIEIHGFAPLTENMPGGNALKPGDVLKTMRGKTIEVLNTDAEGRLVLSDTLTYACRQQLDEIVDIATLTGACVVALGTQIVGLMGTSDLLKEKIKSASQKAGEKVWELPLEKEYLSLIKSPVADIKNIGPVGEAGTIIGGLFLKEFVEMR
jgi:leucyl aminopeptidase